jgi:hypothetical protein
MLFSQFFFMHIWILLLDCSFAVLPDRISDHCLSTCDSTHACSEMCGLSSLSVKDRQIELLSVLIQENRCDCGCHTWSGTRVCYWTIENIDRHHCRLLRAHGAWVGLALPAVRGEEDREQTFKVGDGATGSRTVTGVGDDDGGTTDGIEAEGGVANRVGATGSGMV